MPIQFDPGAIVASLRDITGCGTVAFDRRFLTSRHPRHPPPGAADSIAPTVYSDIKITNILEGRIAFTTAAGNTVDKELASVVAIFIDDEPQFNQAEQDYAADRLDRAIDEFNQTVQNTDKPWLKAYCQPMLTDAANKSGRFDLAVQGYVYLVLNQPATAAGVHLTVPPADSPYLDGAAKSLSDASNTSGISPQQQAALLSLLLDVDRRRKDTAAIDNVASRLTKIAGDAGGPTADQTSRGPAQTDAQPTQQAVVGGNEISPKSVQELRKAATSGDTDAMCTLGLMFESGKGVAQDYRQAMSWYQKAGEWG